MADAAIETLAVTLGLTVIVTAFDVAEEPVKHAVALDDVKFSVANML